MSTAQTWRTESTSLDATLRLAGQVGHKMRGGEVIELVSDLSGGKTAFVRGLASGLGSPDPVHSPSFTLTNQYQAGQLTLYHFDFYRLREPGILKNELAEILANPNAAVVIEWADIVEDVLPAKHLTVKLEAIPESKTHRRFIFSYPPELAYLVPRNT